MRLGDTGVTGASRDKQGRRIKMYYITVSGEQGNYNWHRSAKTLIGAKRIASREASIGIDYKITDETGHTIALLEAWGSLNRWGHTWEVSND